MIALLFVPLFLTFAEFTQQHYSARDVDALRALCAEASTTEATLLCRYRLYPLTKEDTLLDDLPVRPDEPTTRTLALLSGLWGYRAANAPVVTAVRYGLYSDRLLRQARELSPDDPFVLLVEGQSLLFRPRLAGRDAEAALERFRRLESVLPRHPHCGISRMEARIWIWFTLRDLDPAEARQLRRDLLADRPPPLYRQFLSQA